PQGLGLLDSAPVARATTGRGEEETEVWLALSHRAVRQVLGDVRFSRAAAVEPGAPPVLRSAYLPGALTSLDPPRHTGFRHLFARAFSPRMVSRLEPWIQRTADRLLDSLRVPGDLIRPYAESLPIMVICELLGVPLKDREQIRQWTYPLLSTTAYTPEEITAAVREVSAYVRELIEERRRHPDDKLISALVAANDREQVLSPEELVINVQGVLIAGHETTVNQIGNSVLTLFSHPAQLALVQEQPELWPSAVEELLRHSRLADGILPRVALEDVDLDGVMVRAGEAVIPIIAVANRDPDAFPDPHRFDVLRKHTAQHMGLGHGPHFCLGSQLARVELRVALSSLFARYPGLEPAARFEALRWKEGLVVRGLIELPVRLKGGVDTAGPVSAA
ncbi:cytochrome P450, partial [Streptomyces sp. NPDC058548]